MSKSITIQSENIKEAPKYQLYFIPILLGLALATTTWQISLIIAFCSIILSFGKYNRIRFANFNSDITMSFYIFCGLCLISGLWCHFGDCSYVESIKYISIVSIYLLLITTITKDKIHYLLSVVCYIVAIVALICIDASSIQLISKAFIYFVNVISGGALKDSITLSTIGYEEGTRITGIYKNANVSASVIAIGILITLYLFNRQSSQKFKLSYAICLGIMSLAFLLSFSMGAIVAFIISCIIYVIISNKEDRLTTILQMLICIVSTFICAIFSSNKLGTISAIPIILSIFNGIIIFFVNKLIISKLSFNSKISYIALIGLFIIFVIYLIIGFSAHSPINLENSSISRSIYLDTGDYNIEYSSNGQLNLKIYSQNKYELIMHTNTVLYEGKLDNISFSVPEDSKIMWFELEGTGEIDSIILSNGKSIALNYKFLPSFVANRLQGLFANQNLIQRIVFFEDGIKLWLKSPIIGWGIGGVEGQLTSVQSFYYETRYIHNHFIQVLDETGIIGLIAYVYLLICIIKGLIKIIKARSELSPMLTSCISMMVLHSLIEVVWSTQYYMTLLACILTITQISIKDDNTQVNKKSSKSISTLKLISYKLIICIFTIFIASSSISSIMMKNVDYSNMSVEEYISFLLKVDNLNIYNDAETKESIIGTITNTQASNYYSLALKEAKILDANKEFNSSMYASKYYYLPFNDIDNLFTTMEIGLLQEKSNPDAWNNAFQLFDLGKSAILDENFPEYASNVMNIYNLFSKTNNELIGKIELTQDNLSFINDIKVYINSNYSQDILSNLKSK